MMSRPVSASRSSSANMVWKAGHVADPKIDVPAYHRYAVRLVEEGFVAPESLYFSRTGFAQFRGKGAR